jgi:hypothetical protein
MPDLRLSWQISLLGCANVLLGTSVPRASNNHISFIFSIKQSEQVSGSAHPTTQHNIQQQLNLQQVPLVNVSKGRVENQIN